MTTVEIIESAKRIVSKCAWAVGQESAYRLALPQSEPMPEWEIDEYISVKSEQVDRLTQAGLAPHTAQKFVKAWWDDAEQEGYDDTLFNIEQASEA